ncbi:MAG: pseudouridine-5'-phosphate glycosidase [Oceanospirillaceae bacterium]|nr:pseudouridine-5'-phosphate glycosidase [Oceanospirillaceae bacterium]
MLKPYLDTHPEVAEALTDNRPVVALESTIIAHGMPYPRNVETALRVEEAVRSQGAIPATIAIIEGRLTVGLEREQIEALGREGREAAKVSRRDIPFIVAAGGTGATTVAATMILAAMAGIRIFATGGIGGVHRGATQTFDISADLQELAQTDVAVVCAGAKSILDLGLTLEYLETQGVPVVGYRTDSLPAFYTRDSGFAVDYRLDSPETVAQALRTKWDLGLRGGVVIANPISEPYAMATEAIDAAIEQALQEADAQGIHGKATTPFLLARVAELTGGDSLESNIQLVLNNARLAAQIAKAFVQC